MIPSPVSVAVISVMVAVISVLSEAVVTQNKIKAQLNGSYIFLLSFTVKCSHVLLQLIFSTILM